MILKRLWAWDRLRKKAKMGKEQKIEAPRFCVADLSMVLA